MHEQYDDEDSYSDDDNDYNYPKNNPYQWYYKFDVGPDTPVSNWLTDMINKWINTGSLDKFNDSWGFVNIPGFPFKKLEFPVNSWNPDTGKNKFQYLGSNYQGSSIWKTQYFVVDKINNQYKLHLQSHVQHFVQQPSYYNGMFDILN